METRGMRRSARSSPEVKYLADSQNNGWTLRHKHTLFPRRAVNKIILLPKVSKCFILSGKS